VVIFAVTTGHLPFNPVGGTSSCNENLLELILELFSHGHMFSFFWSGFCFIGISLDKMKVRKEIRGEKEKEEREEKKEKRNREKKEKKV
jgi:hypothetical protein